MNWKHIHTHKAWDVGRGTPDTCRIGIIRRPLHQFIVRKVYIYDSSNVNSQRFDTYHRKCIDNIVFDDLLNWYGKLLCKIHIFYVSQSSYLKHSKQDYLKVQLTGIRYTADSGRTTQNTPRYNLIDRDLRVIPGTDGFSKKKCHKVNKDVVVLGFLLKIHSLYKINYWYMIFMKYKLMFTENIRNRKLYFLNIFSI